MKTLHDYIVAGALYQGGTGPEAQVGDQVRLFLDTEADPDFPEFILGVIQHPIVKVQCDSSTSYSIEYDPADLEGAAALLRAGDIVDAVVVSELTALTESLVGKADLVASEDSNFAQIFTGQHKFTGGVSILNLTVGSPDTAGTLYVAGTGGLSAALIQNDLSSDGTYSLPNAFEGILVSVPGYDDLTEANTYLAAGDFWWDKTLTKLRVATA